MSSPRLRAQFERLFEYFQGQDSTVQMEDIMEALVCSQRNVRMVLNKLENEGWIDWQPAAGRGKHSQLFFKCDKQDVSNTLAKRYIEQGKFDNALAVLNHDPIQLKHLLAQYFGLNRQEIEENGQQQGQVVLRLPHYQAFKTLHPHNISSEAEHQLINWVFSGLTCHNENDEFKTPQADLAYQWRMISPIHWQFYLRNGVRFHNGNLLTANDVITSLKALNLFPLFAHIDDIFSSETNVIDIKLTHADYYLPQLLARPEAKIILLEDTEHNDKVVGTGAYKITNNENSRLILQTNEQYFGQRPVVDRIELSHVSADEEMVYSALMANYQATANDQVTDNAQKSIGSQKLENAQNIIKPHQQDPMACVYFLMNQKSNVWQDRELLPILNSALTPLSLFKYLLPQQVMAFGLLPAFNLLPGHQLPKSQLAETQSQSQTKLTQIEDSLLEKRQLSLAYLEGHPLSLLLISAIKLSLKSVNINLNLIKYAPSNASQCMKEADLILNMHSVSAQNYTWMESLLNDNFNYHKAIDNNIVNSCIALINQWRKGELSTFPLQKISDILITNKQILPVFHYWQSRDPQACGANNCSATSALSWWDLYNVSIIPHSVTKESAL